MPDEVKCYAMFYDNDEPILEIFEDEQDSGLLVMTLPDAKNYDSVALDINDVIRLRDIFNQHIEKDGTYSG